MIDVFFTFTLIVFFTLMFCIIVAMFFLFDHEILYGYFAKKVRKHFGVTNED